MSRTVSIRILFATVSLVAFTCMGAGVASAQTSGEVASAQTSEEVRVNPLNASQAEPPRVTASAEELERRADELRAQKSYFDALDYYRAAIEKSPKNASLYNKAGICELQTQRYRDAEREFKKAIHADKTYADAYNNLGVVQYESKKYTSALHLYAQAIKLKPNSASFYSNQGAAYFSRKNFDDANVSYLKAMQLDPDIFERSSHSGVAARLPSPDDRARYDFSIARLYAQNNVPDRALVYLRRAMEEGYNEIDRVYKEEQFSSLRKDPRFFELMKSRPMPIAN
jgi:tetratricopeptide (TPR) repeat protein